MRKNTLSTSKDNCQASIEKFPLTMKKKYRTLFITLLILMFTSPQAYASMAEHQAVLNLVPITSMDRQVVNSGAWSNPATWNGGILPKSGENIYVPNDKSLVVDIESNLSFNTVRVDGIITFATDRNVMIKLDTLVVTETGTFEIGAETDRVPSLYKVQITIADNGPIDRKWDPSNISRGIILQGKTRIYGSEKSAYQKLSINPNAGASQITLAAIPTGWMKGDIIAITATKFRKKLPTDTSYQTEDELRTIKSISGNVVTLGKVNNTIITDPLTYSHVSTIPNMPVYAANLTRNVAFIGEGGKSVPPSQRGHFMVMHNPDTIIKGASFNYFGRTDKSIRINDFKLKDNNYRDTDINGNYIPDVSTNPRGRYSVHFHHTGTDIKVPPAICSGNAVFSSNGWGFVNHTSNVIMENNASYDVLGSHFVSEDGNELGAFKNNIAIKSEGSNKGVKIGSGNHDGGHSGHGFWLESRNLSVSDNIVSGVSNAGIIYFHRIYIKGINTEIPRENLLTPQKGIVKNQPTIYYRNIPITVQKNTTVLASRATLTVVKDNRNQQHDLRNIIESLKGYAVVDGINIQYSENYTFKGIELVADSSTTPWNQGLSFVPDVKSIAIVDANINGFIHPIVTGTTFRDLPDNTDVLFSNVKVNGRGLIPMKDIQQSGKVIVSNYNPKLHVVNNFPNTNPNSLTFTISKTLPLELPSNLSDGFTVQGTKNDSLDMSDFVSKWKYGSLLTLIKKGYYASSDGSKYIVLSDIIADKFDGHAKTVNIPVKIISNYPFLGPFLGNL